MEPLDPAALADEIVTLSALCGDGKQMSEDHKQLIVRVLRAAAASRRPEERRIYEPGERVIVAFDSGHIEEGVVQKTVVWVKDATGYSFECRLGQISRTTTGEPQEER